jgi:hypothetical protein
MRRLGVYAGKKFSLLLGVCFYTALWLFFVFVYMYVLALPIYWLYQSDLERRDRRKLRLKEAQAKRATETV